MNIDIILSVGLGAAVTFIMMLITSFTKNLGRKLTEPIFIKKIKEQEEQIKIKHNMELQELINKHNEELQNKEYQYKLDFEKRKYTFEQKWKIYQEYFELLDSLEGSNFENFVEEFMPILSKFNENYLKAKDNPELLDKVLQEYFEEMQVFYVNQYKAQIPMNNQLNRLKTICSDKITNILTQIKKKYDEGNELAKQLSTALTKMVIYKDISKKNLIEQKLQEQGRQLKTLRDELIKEVKAELEIT